MSLFARPNLNEPQPEGLRSSTCINDDAEHGDRSSPSIPGRREPLDGMTPSWPYRAGSSQTTSVCEDNHNVAAMAARRDRHRCATDESRPNRPPMSRVPTVHSSRREAIVSARRRYTAARRLLLSANT
jgi:hypothetical protein